MAATMIGVRRTLCSAAAGRAGARIVRRFCSKAPDQPPAAAARAVGQTDFKWTASDGGFAPALPPWAQKPEVTPHDLSGTNVFLGHNTRYSHPDAYQYLLGDVGGYHIIDPNQTIFELRKVLHFIKKISFRDGKVLFISTQPNLARLTRVMAEQTGSFYLAKRWVPGMLTNFNKLRNFVRNKIELESVSSRGKKLRHTDFQKAQDFKGVKYMTRPPDVIFKLDGTNIRTEAATLNIPVISVVDTDLDLDNVDYPIPANSNSLRFYHTLAHLVVRAMKEGKELRSDLNKYKDTAAELAQIEERDRGRSSRRGGSVNRKEALDAFLGKTSR